MLNVDKLSFKAYKYVGLQKANDLCFVNCVIWLMKEFIRNE